MKRNKIPLIFKKAQKSPSKNISEGAGVPEVGLEPTQPNGQGILSPSCLPFHHSGNLVAGAKLSTFFDSDKKN